MAITAISAALGLGRLIALPFAGPLSDKLGRRISTAIGSGSYAIYLIGLALHLMQEQMVDIRSLMYVRSSEVLQTPSWIQEFIRQLQRSSTKHRVLLQWEFKFFIAIAQMILPFVLGATVATTATGLVSYNMLFYICGVIYVVLLVLVMLFPLPDADQKAAGKKEGLIDSLKHTHFSIESVAMILIGFTCTGTFQLWLNCAQNFAK